MDKPKPSPQAKVESQFIDVSGFDLTDKDDRLQLDILLQLQHAEYHEPRYMR